MQAERIAQHLDQALVRSDLRLHAFAVQAESDAASHRLDSAMKTASGLSGSSVSRTRPVSVSTSSPTPLAPTIQKGVALSVWPFSSGGVYGGMKLPAPVTEPARMPYFFLNTSAVAVSAGRPSSLFSWLIFCNAS